MIKSIPKEIRYINNLLKRNIEVQTKDDDVTRVQGWIIGFIYHHQDLDVFQKDIEKELNMRRSTASEVIKTMENKGYVKRESVDYDQRLKKLVLTQKAINHQHKFMKFAEQFDEKVASGLTNEELTKFYEILDKIKSNLK